MDIAVMIFLVTSVFETASISFSMMAVSLACMPVPYQVLRRAQPLRLFSCRQILVGNALSRRRVYQSIQPLERVLLDVSRVQAERELIDIARHVLRARVVIRAVQPALENRPDAFNSIRAQSIAHVFILLVTDLMVLLVHMAQAVPASRSFCKSVLVIPSALVPG
jgi:hypothetical protein